MTDETQIDNIEEVQPEAKVEESGYIADKEEFEKKYPGKEFKSEEEFARDGSFFKKIDSLNQKIKQQEESLRALAEHNRKVAAVARQQKLQELEAERNAAIETGDKYRFEEVDRVLEHVKNEPDTVPVIQSDAVNRFVSDHKSWFNSDTPENQNMVATARGLAQWALNNRPDMVQDEDKFRTFVEGEMVRYYPHRFKQKNVSKVDSPVRGEISSSMRGIDTSRLTDAQAKTMQRVVRTGVMSAKEYMQQLKDLGEI